MKLIQDIYLVGSGEFGISDEYDCHCYLIDGGDDAVLIDCGVGYQPELIEGNIEDFGKVSRVLITHLHADHCGGTTYFRNKGLEVWVPKTEWQYAEHNMSEILEAYKVAQTSGCYPEGKMFPLIESDRLITTGEIIRVGKYSLETIELRGHSPGLMVYLLDTGEKRCLFSSDYVFANGVIGLLNCPGSDLSMYRCDMNKLAERQIDCLFPGHRMITLRNGQSAIDKATLALAKIQIPLAF